MLLPLLWDIETQDQYNNLSEKSGGDFEPREPPDVLFFDGYSSACLLRCAFIPSKGHALVSPLYRYNWKQQGGGAKKLDQLDGTATAS